VRTRVLLRDPSPSSAIVRHRMLSGSSEQERIAV